MPPSSTDVQRQVIPATGDFLEDLPEPRIVIGPDNRKIVKEPSGVMSTICLIGNRVGPVEEDITKNVTVGTAWLINKNHLLTAGHCIYDPNFTNSRGDHYAEHTAIYVGSSGGKFSHYRQSSNLYAGGDFVDNVGNWVTEPLSKFDDWGVVTLNSPVNLTSYLGVYAVNSASDMTNRYYYTAGYPEDLNKPKHVSWNYWDMYYTNGRILQDKKRFLDVVTTDIDFYVGQSGSPVYSYRDSYGWCAETIIVRDNVELGENYLLLINDWLANELRTTFS